MRSLANSGNRAQRRRVLSTSVLATVMLVLIALKLVTMQVGQILGDRAWRSGNIEAAQRWFEMSHSVNVAERWIAPYNLGVAAASAGNWYLAASRFEDAYETAPSSARCVVALNWSWSLEALGDEFAAAGDSSQSQARWSEAESVLAKASGCDDGRSSRQPQQPPPELSEDAQQDSSDASEQQRHDDTAQRIAKKKGGREPEDAPSDSQPSEQEKAEQLAERNDDAARTRQRENDRNEGADGGSRKMW
jgi:tetratricopeptide (TPR) repeat protein